MQTRGPPRRKPTPEPQLPTMSVKFERDTVKNVQSAASAAASRGPIPGTSGEHPLAEAVGTALTGGKAAAGTKGYLAVRSLLPRSSPRWRADH